jgi:hypothetical protein
MEEREGKLYMRTDRQHIFRDLHFDVFFRQAGAQDAGRAAHRDRRLDREAAASTVRSFPQAVGILRTAFFGSAPSTQHSFHFFHIRHTSSAARNSQSF